MVAYHQFVEFSQSDNSEQRGQAAHLAAMAYLAHMGPADEQAALYAALISFLDDPSVKVRAALAYGMLHSPHAPRPIVLALLQDLAVISRAVAQYSPVLVDADLLALIAKAEPSLLVAIAMRQKLSTRVAEALIARGDAMLTLKILMREDLSLNEALLVQIAEEHGADPQMRGALLARQDLPARARLLLVMKATEALRSTRIVAGAIAPQRLERLLRNSADTALTEIGEREAGTEKPHYAAAVISADQLNTRVLLHALVNGHALFFANCLAELSEVPLGKVFAVLERGSRPALQALLGRCGLKPQVANLTARLVLHAREADLADDVTARHFVVTALTEELLLEHDSAIPAELEEAFCYLSEQNVLLARQAARGVMSAFAEESNSDMPELQLTSGARLALPAA